MYSTLRDYLAHAQAVFATKLSKPILVVGFELKVELPERLGGHDYSRNSSASGGQQGGGKSADDHAINQGKEWLKYKKRVTGHPGYDRAVQRIKAAAQGKKRAEKQESKDIKKVNEHKKAQSLAKKAKAAQSQQTGSSSRSSTQPSGGSAKPNSPSSQKQKQTASSASSSSIEQARAAGLQKQQDAAAKKLNAEIKGLVKTPAVYNAMAKHMKANSTDYAAATTAQAKVNIFKAYWAEELLKTYKASLKKKKKSYDVVGWRNKIKVFRQDVLLFSKGEDYGNAVMK
ncbi:MAG: hypothetical protein AAF393_06770 [Pseudomonadota bacterium]